MYRKAVLTVGVIAAAFLLPAGAASAQVSRTFVSGSGTDTGACPVTAPCRSFAYAITQTVASGEIVVLSSAGYGPVTIGQSLTITNPGGVEAGITATSGNAITIDPTAAAKITLRGLTLEGGGSGANGIVVSSAIPALAPASVLNILGCVIKDFSTDGVQIGPAITGSGDAIPSLSVSISDSFILENATNGIEAESGGPAVWLGIYRTMISGNGTGISSDHSQGANTISVVSSNIDANMNSGITASSVAGGSYFLLKASTVAGTGHVSGQADITNSQIMYLYDANEIGVISTQEPGATDSDGTNDIGTVTGAALQKTAPQ